MTAIKTMAASMIVWGTLGTFAQGAPMAWYGGSSSWPTWYANQLQDNSQVASSGVGNYYLGGKGNYVWWLNSPAPAPAASGFATAPTSSTSTPPVTAYINFGNGPYAEASTLTTGTPQAWYNSPAVSQAFGGTPSAAQRLASPRRSSPTFSTLFRSVG